MLVNVNDNNKVAKNRVNDAIVGNVFNCVNICFSSVTII